MRLSILLTVCVYSASQSVKLPPNFQKCNRKDPDFQKCVLEAAQSGLSQLTKPFEEVSLPTLDPLDVVELRVGTASKVVNFDQKNCKLYGIDKTEFSKFEFDFEKKSLYAEGVVPELQKNCDYELEGKILLLPLTGTVPSEVSIKNMTVTALSHYEETKKGNRTFLKFGNTKLTLDPGFMSFYFGNILHNDQFSEKINEDFNRNWEKVFGDFKEEYEENFGVIVENLINRFFSKVSLEEAFD
ncbi:JHBP domain containing protein [Asbolus verrucosus]|uniref:JHBP domain containing protein n=1 Tax=Asbolus verrucosus TaxID=1661398 RepID=A0A482VKQ7_ASBVE|nr:JHBP domain containing protein [Asbolus verrucosus]